MFLFIRDIWNCVRYVYSLYRVYRCETDINAVRVKRAANRCGAIGNKLLQFLVSTEGFFSSAFKRKFDYVLDRCDNHSFQSTLAMYYDDFARDLFADFDICASDVNPIGSGTIGQVYKFYYPTLGKHVAVKVKHPGADKQAQRFAASLTRVMWFIEKFHKLPFASILKEFLINVSLQLDYIVEADNMQRMHNNFKNEHHIVVPEVYACSSNFIVMSYHEGISFNDIADNKLRTNVSLDVYLFMLDSIINHDFLHCDLHVGNWKVGLKPDGSHDFIVYDCGLTSAVGDKDTCKNIVISMLNDDYLELGKIMVPDWKNQALWPELAEFIKEVVAAPNRTYAERYGDLFKKALSFGMPLNTYVIHVLQGVLLCLQVINVSRLRLSRVIGNSGNCKEVMLCYNLAMLRKIGKYPSLTKSFEEWANEDPNTRRVFEEWLEETFGHKDESVFVDIMIDGLVI